MQLATIAVTCLLAGAVCSWFIQRDERKYLRDELRVAHAQIAHAVIKDGAEIPMRFEEPEPMEALSPALQEAINDWEDPESRAVQEAKIRDWQARGHGEQAILRRFSANPEAETV